MLSFFNKYLNKKPSDKIKEEEKEKKKNRNQMVPPNSSPDVELCCSAPDCLGLTTSASGTTDRQARNSSTTIPRAITTTRTCRSDFAKTTTSSVFPNTQFTNHESLPRLSEAFSNFKRTYPQFKETQEADRIRQQNYSHLSEHVCLDYTGFTLFSHSQLLSCHHRHHSATAFFGISYKSASLKSQVQYGNSDRGFESAIRNRIMSFLNVSQEDYSMVCTANRTSAFKLLAETYPFHHKVKLLTVYDYESEAVSSMVESASKRGAKLMSPIFSWPGLRIHSAGLKRALQNNKKKKIRGLFVFPLQSRMTGARYPYLWMRMAKENGWHVLLDACALGPKDLDTLGLSLIQPDFIICSFFKVVGENPSGFASLLIKKSTGSVLETSVIARSIGVVSIVPASEQSQASDDLSGTFSDMDNRSFSGPMSGLICNGNGAETASRQMFEHGETSQPNESISTDRGNDEKTTPSEIVELESNKSAPVQEEGPRTRDAVEIECAGLDHADSLGLLLISSRLRYITNWLVMALARLRHPNLENGYPLVKIYGPRIKFDRGAAIAFNVFDWKGEKVEPILVQKLADRSNISLSCGFLRNIWFSDKYEAERDAVLERRNSPVTENNSASRRKEDADLGIAVVNASLGFMTNFEDAYKLWSFVARFLDADFVEKERWRYMALNQKMIEV